MAFFVKVTPRNFGFWMALLTREAARSLAAKLRGGPAREEEVLRHVRQQATEGDPWSVLFEMDDYARHKRYLMNVGDEKGAILDQAIRDTGATRVLELGCYCGYSAVRTASQLSPDTGRVVSIEKSPKFANIARQVAEFAGVAHMVDIVVGDAGDVIPHLKGPFDLVFIDHWKDRYLPDLLLIEKHGLLHEGSVVVADNVGIFEGAVRTYLHHVRTDPHYETTHLDAHMEYDSHIHDAVEVSIYHDRAA